MSLPKLFIAALLATPNAASRMKQKLDGKLTNGGLDVTSSEGGRCKPFMAKYVCMEATWESNKGCVKDLCALTPWPATVPEAHQTECCTLAEGKEPEAIVVEDDVAEPVAEVVANHEVTMTVFYAPKAEDGLSHKETCRSTCLEAGCAGQCGAIASADDCATALELLKENNDSFKDSMLTLAHNFPQVISGCSLREDHRRVTWNPPAKHETPPFKNLCACYA